MSVKPGTIRFDEAAERAIQNLVRWVYYKARRDDESQVEFEGGEDEQAKGLLVKVNLANSRGGGRIFNICRRADSSIGLGNSDYPKTERG